MWRSPLALFLLAISSAAEVRFVTKGGSIELQRNGQPYLIKGAGGGRVVENLASYGGNSVRLWGDEKLGETLDAAQKAGLTVCAGIWLGQVRQGFNWSDAESLIKQREHIRQVVEKYRDHPALLCWALGNEMEDGPGKNGAVWTAINSLAVMVKQLDPHHPTMTVVAEIGGDKVRNIHKLCPEIDIVGINSYGGASSLPERYRKAGGTKPYILTEFGPAGIWEIGKDALGAYPEPTSTQKAQTYRQIYEKAVLGAPGLCLGSYVFNWGQKQEVTSTWFSLFLGDGSRLEPVDAMTTLWTGKAPANRCPQIASLAWEGTPRAAPGATLRATLSASDPENDTLKVEWLLQQDPGSYGTGGDAEKTPPLHLEAIMHGDLKGAEIKLPERPGLYRLFAIARDGHGGAAIGNLTLRVEAPK